MTSRDSLYLASRLRPISTWVPFDLVVHRLADVVQETGPLGHVHVGAELGGHDPGQVRHLDGVLQDVLAVAGPELQPAQELDQLRVQAVYARLEGGLLALFADRWLSTSFCALSTISSMRAGWMRPSATSFFRAIRAISRRIGIEARKDDRLGRVVDDQVDPGRASRACGCCAPRGR